MTFQGLHENLARHIAKRVRCGELTERGLARRSGISQPHLHHVLKGKRYFSLHSADLVLRELGLTVFDLADGGGNPAAGR